MQNSENDIAPRTCIAAEALANLVTLGRGQQYAQRAQKTQPEAPEGAIAESTPSASIFSTGRLRGSSHYEALHAQLAQDNLAKFLNAISNNTARAAAVRSVKFDAYSDDPQRSGLIDLFNEILPTYAFTPDASYGPFPPLTEAALHLKAYQREMASNSAYTNIYLPPVDLTKLDADWLSLPPFGDFLLEIYVDLFVKLCPNLEVIEIPSVWGQTPDLPFTEARKEKWRQEHEWDVEVKEYEQDEYVRIGRKGGWKLHQVQYWMQMIVDDIAKHG